MLTLKTGNIVQLRDGTEMLILRSSTVGDILLSINPEKIQVNKLELYNFTVDLKYCTNHEYDIIKVWNPKDAYNINSMKDKGILIYDRENDIE